MIGRDITWKVDGLPVVYGDESLLKLVVVNIISNAVKFTSNRPHAEIEIACRKEGNEEIFFIRTMAQGLTWIVSTGSLGYSGVSIQSPNLKAPALAWQMYVA